MQRAADGSKYTDVMPGAEKETGAECEKSLHATYSSQLLINRYLQGDNQFIPLFNLPSPGFFGILIYLPQALLSYEYQEKNMHEKLTK